MSKLSKCIPVKGQKIPCCCLPRLYGGIKSNKIQNFSQKPIRKAKENIPILDFNSKSGWLAINYAYDVWSNNNSFLTVGVPRGKFTYDGQEYNTYLGYILNLNNELMDLSEAGRVTTNETLTNKNLHFFQTPFDVNTDLSQLISLSDFTIRYGVNRAQVLIGYVLYVYDNTTVKFKLFLYDVVKPLDANGNQFLTFDETNNITIMSLSELQNKTNNLKLSDLLDGVNQNGLKYIYINDPVLTSFSASGLTLYNWNYNYYNWLKIQTKNDQIEHVIFNKNILMDIPFTKLGYSTFENYFENTVKTYYEKNPTKETKPYILSSITPALLEYSTIYLYENLNPDSIPKYNEIPNNYFKRRSITINSDTYQDSFMYNHMNGRRFKNISYFILTAEDLVKKTYNKDYVLSNVSIEVPIDFILNLSPKNSDILKSWIKSNI